MITAATNDVVWALELRSALFSPLMARNALKSNVTWTSYPFVPPTSASGFFADLLSGMKWYERNDNRVRHLHRLPGWEGVVALGAYPTYGQMSRRHFRAHLGSLAFNYEAYVWAAGRNEGKKLAVIEEFLTDELRFVVIAREPDSLYRLYQAVRGRVAPIAKKGSVQLEFSAHAKLEKFEKVAASGKEKAIALVPVNEIGAFPLSTLPNRTPLRSESTDKGIVWHVRDCLWSNEISFQQGVPIYQNGDRGISCSLVQTIVGANQRFFLSA